MLQTETSSVKGKESSAHEETSFAYAINSCVDGMCLLSTEGNYVCGGSSEEVLV